MISDQHKHRELVVLSAHPLHGPLVLAQRAFVVLLDPLGHAAVVERVVAFTPDDDTVLLVLFAHLALALEAFVWKEEKGISLFI